MKFRCHRCGLCGSQPKRAITRSDSRMLAASQTIASIRLISAMASSAVRAARNVRKLVPYVVTMYLQRQKVRHPPRLVVIQQTAIGLAALMVPRPQRQQFRHRNQLRPRPQMHGPEIAAGRFDHAIAVRTDPLASGRQIANGLNGPIHRMTAGEPPYKDSSLFARVKRRQTGRF